MKSILRVIGFVLISFFCIEATLRFTNPPALQYYRNLKMLHRFNESYYVELAKNEDLYLKHFQGLWEGRFTTNSLGYRGSAELDSQKKIIACLGDSLVMGFGVSDEQSFCHLLDNIRIKNEVYQSQNIGVDAFGSLGYSRRLTETSEQIPLNKVLLFISPNDFTIPPALRAQGILPDDENDAIRLNNDKLRRAFKIQFLITQYSFTAMATKLSIEQLKLRLIITKESIATEWNEATNNEANKGFLKYLDSSFYSRRIVPCKNESVLGEVQCPPPLPEDFQCQAQPTNPNDLEPLPTVTQQAYNDMIQLSKEKNIELITVLLPVQKEDMYCTMHGKHSALYDYALRAKDYMQKRGVRVIDLRPRITTVCNDPRFPDRQIDHYYIPGDGHLTVTGNRWVAEILKEELTK